jgi:hypothetical protein
MVRFQRRAGRGGSRGERAHPSPERIPLEGALEVEVRITEAAAEHVVAWDTDQRVKAVRVEHTSL